MREMFMEVSQSCLSSLAIRHDFSGLTNQTKLSLLLTIWSYPIFFVNHVEEDDMNPCAQEALLNCTGFGKKNWPTYLASLFDAYFACLENTATTCDAPIWQHLLITYEALKEELNKNRGKFNQLSLNVTQNPEDVVQVYSAKIQSENLDTVLTSMNQG